MPEIIMRSQTSSDDVYFLLTFYLFESIYLSLIPCI